MSEFDISVDPTSRVDDIEAADALLGDLSHGPHAISSNTIHHGALIPRWHSASRART
jgi:hypothetical protein